MRPGARREHVRCLRELADSVREAADKIETAELPDLRRVGVGWGNNGCEIDVGGTYVFKMPRDEKHIVDIIRALACGILPLTTESRIYEIDKAPRLRRLWRAGDVEAIPERLSSNVPACVRSHAGGARVSGPRWAAASGEARRRKNEEVVVKGK